DDQVLDASLDIDPVALSAPAPAVIDGVALDGHIAVRRITGSGAVVHHAAPADVQRFAKRIVHHVIADDDVVAGGRIGRAALVRAVRGGHQQDARTVARAGGVFALAVLHDPVVAADGDLLAPARGGHVQTV